MTFDELVDYIKADGCKVIVYKNKSKTNGAYGEFLEDPPTIRIAISDHPKKFIISTLLHEYGHYLQYKDRFLIYIDNIIDTYELFHMWTEENVELSEFQINTARNAMLALEYDAEMRAYKLGQDLGINGFDPEFHLQEAACYMTYIKWAWHNRKEWIGRPIPNMWQPKILTPRKLFAKLTKKEKKIIESFNVKV